MYKRQAVARVLRYHVDTEASFAKPGKRSALMVPSVLRSAYSGASSRTNHTTEVPAVASPVRGADELDNDDVVVFAMVTNGADSSEARATTYKGARKRSFMEGTAQDTEARKQNRPAPHGGGPVSEM